MCVVFRAVAGVRRGPTSKAWCFQLIGSVLFRWERHSLRELAAGVGKDFVACRFPSLDFARNRAAMHANSKLSLDLVFWGAAICTHTHGGDGRQILMSMRCVTKDVCTT